MEALTKNTYMSLVGPESGVILLDFWAEWCGPCRLLKPQLQELSGECVGKATIYSVDVDSEGDLAVEFGIRSIPTVIIFVNGVLRDKIIGVNPKELYKEKIDTYFAEITGVSSISSTLKNIDDSDNHSH